MKRDEALRNAIDKGDALIYGAIATAKEGVEETDGPAQEHTKRFLVIEDLLTGYREAILAALDGKAA